MTADAQAIDDWLSSKIGEAYRLPSEAEWAYAARAETTTRYWPGDAIAADYASFGGTVGRTIEVGSKGRQHGFGLLDAHGNVWERVEDSRCSDYQGAPGDGSAWIDCSTQVLCGGFRSDNPEGRCSANRSWIDPIAGNDFFRITGCLNAPMIAELFRCFFAALPLGVWGAAPAEFSPLSARYAHRPRAHSMP